MKTTFNKSFKCGQIKAILDVFGEGLPGTTAANIAHIMTLNRSLSYVFKYIVLYTLNQIVSKY